MEYLGIRLKLSRLPLKKRSILFQNEFWKDIEGYEGLYQISSLGRVWRYDQIGRKPWKLKRCAYIKSFNNSGYRSATLYKNNTWIQKKIHRLISIAFISNPDPINKDQVNHKNGVTYDNRICNLEWVTPKENVDHAYATGLSSGKVGVKHPMALLTEEDVMFIRSNAMKYSNEEFSTMFNTKKTTIIAVIKNQNWLHLPLCEYTDHKTHRQVFNVDTGIFYDSTLEAYRATNGHVPYMTFYGRLIHNRINKTNFRLL